MCAVIDRLYIPAEKREREAVSGIMIYMLRGFRAPMYMFALFYSLLSRNKCNTTRDESIAFEASDVVSKNLTFYPILLSFPTISIYFVPSERHAMFHVKVENQRVLYTLSFNYPVESRRLTYIIYNLKKKQQLFSYRIRGEKSRYQTQLIRNPTFSSLDTYITSPRIRDSPSDVTAAAAALFECARA